MVNLPFQEGCRGRSPGSSSRLLFVIFVSAVLRLIAGIDEAGFESLDKDPGFAEYRCHGFPPFPGTVSIFLLVPELEGMVLLSPDALVPDFPQDFPPCGQHPIDPSHD